MFFGKKAAEKSCGVLDMSRIPRHIGIIMDGNGRWAKRRGLPRTAGHRQGAKTLETISEYCASIGVEAITAYAFSTENWNRPAAEVSAIMGLLREYLSDVETRFAKNNARFIASGDMSAFDEDMRRAVKHAVDVTREGKSITINLAINYGGRDELVRAAKRLCTEAKAGLIAPPDIDEELLGSYMDTAGLPEVDLIIRPSGEQRLSNFLLWQAAYAELWYSDICWPDFKPKDMKAAIIDYQRRDRRFGRV